MKEHIYDDLDEADPNLDFVDNDDEYGATNYGPINETVGPDINPLARTDEEYMLAHPSSTSQDISNIHFKEVESSYDDTNSAEPCLASIAHGECDCRESIRSKDTLSEDNDGMCLLTHISIQ